MRLLLPLLFALCCARAAAADAAGREWTALVWMQSEGDLGEHAERDLRALLAHPASPRVGLAVQLDRPGRTGLLRIADGVRTQLPERDGEAEADRLRDFVAWGRAQLPSRRTLVLIWGHGQGYAGGVAINARTGGRIDAAGLRRALSAAGAQVDVLVLDACLMQSVELLSDLAGAARYVLGSAQVESFQGLPHGALLSALASAAAASTDDALALARASAAMVAAAYAPGGEQGARDPGAGALLAFSAVDPAAVRERLVPALDALGGALSEVLARDPAWVAVLRAALSRAPAYTPGQPDVGALLQLLERERLRELDRAEAREAAQALAAPLQAAQRALDAAVLAHALGAELTSPAYTGFAGPPAARAMSIWTPSRAAARELDAISGSSLHRLAPRWAGLLRSLARPQ